MKLSEKLDECEPHIAKAQIMEYIHGRTYTGPNYVNEKAALLAFLARERSQGGK